MMPPRIKPDNFRQFVSSVIKTQHEQLKRASSRGVAASAWSRITSLNGPMEQRSGSSRKREIRQSNKPAGAKPIKLFTTVIYKFRSRLEC